MSRNDRDKNEFKRAVKRDGSEWEIGIGFLLFVVILTVDLLSTNAAPFQIGKMTIGYALGAGIFIYGCWNRFS